MRVIVLPYRRWLDDHGRRVLVIGCILISLLLALFLAAPAAYADSPFNDPMAPRPQGGGVGVGGDGTLPDAPPEFPAFPDGYQELPPPLMRSSWAVVSGMAPRAPLPQQTPDTNPNNPLAWIGLGLNPGKWLLDSVLGAMTGVIYSLAAVFEVLGRFGNGQIVDLNGSITNASDTAFNLLFTTPEGLTIDWPGATGLGSPQAMHDIMRQVALSILVLISTYRAVFVLTGSHARSGLIDLVIGFLGSLAGIQGAWWFCSLFVRAGNLITAAVLQQAFGEGLNNWIPLDPSTYYWSNLSGIQGASLAVALVTIVYWAILALLAVHAIARIVLINLMLIISPLAGLAIATGGGWNYARVWFFRFVELLATPLIWGVTLGLGRALMSGFGAETHPILGPILAIGTILMVFNAPKSLGFAAQEALTGACSLLRMTERSVMTSMMAGGAGVAGSAESVSTPVTVVGVASSVGAASSEWAGASFGATARPQTLLPPPHDSERS